MFYLWNMVPRRIFLVLSVAEEPTYCNVQKLWFWNVDSVDLRYYHKHILGYHPTVYELERLEGGGTLSDPAP
jgi:hypothetical protein